mmetsp:Transcript_3812/g.24118  ORF Transcript_3812/g.24118 Transcript_3812/m.24118 type:complete len:94 (-) Transcript_3812:5467-5748(-)
MQGRSENERELVRPLATHGSFSSHGWAIHRSILLGHANFEDKEPKGNSRKTMEKLRWSHLVTVLNFTECECRHALLSPIAEAEINQREWKVNR